MPPRFSQIVAVHLFLMKEGKILLARRFNTGYEDGNFSVPAGHVEPDEPCTLAMVREAQEEIGIRIHPQDLQLLHMMHRKSQGEHRVDFFFTTQKWHGIPQICEPEKCDHLEWFALESLPSNMVSYVQQAVEAVGSAKLYSERGF